MREVGPGARDAEGDARGRGRLREVAEVSLRLGATSFGGPAAHIALLRHEVVQRRGWVSEQRFLDLLGATNLIPGPNSTEMAIHLGYVRAGWAGLIVGGALFILPGMLSVLALAWAYVSYGTLPVAGWLLYGVKPVIIAVIVQALWRFRATALRAPLPWAIALATLGANLLGVAEIPLLFGGALVALLARVARRPPAASIAALAAPGPLLVGAAGAAAAFSYPMLFLTFLKIGALLYGSGYVLLAFLRGDFVDRLGWLSEQQLLDAVAVGQFTPGPLFTSATFVGYLVGGLPGALLATLGIFLPSFLFVAVTNPHIARIRAFPPTAALLDGVNAAALGLMAAVTLQLGRAALVDAVTVVLALAALVMLGRARVSSAWLVLAGGVVGVATHLLLG